jgi:AcrR family transcriptional regulator
MNKEKTAAAPRRTQAERSHETKQRLLSATSRLIVEKGYADLRVADVAKAAGVSLGAQLHHFPTRDALVAAAIEYSLAEASKLSRCRVRSKNDSEEIIRDLIDDAQEFFFSDHFFIAVNVLMSTTGPSDVREAVLRITREARKPVEKAWEEALVAAGFPKKYVSDIIGLTMSIVRGFPIRELWDKDAGQRGSCIALWREMITLLLEKHRNTQESDSPTKAAITKR